MTTLNTELGFETSFLGAGLLQRTCQERAREFRSDTAAFPFGASLKRGAFFADVGEHVNEIITFLLSILKASQFCLENPQSQFYLSGLYKLYSPKYQNPLSNAARRKKGEGNNSNMIY